MIFGFACFGFTSVSVNFSSKACRKKSRRPGIDALSKGAWEVLIDSETPTQGNNVSSSNFGRDSVWKSKLLPANRAKWLKGSYASGFHKLLLPVNHSRYGLDHLSTIFQSALTLWNVRGPKNLYS